jgi:Tol biopolymer transport system component
MLVNPATISYVADGQRLMRSPLSGTGGELVLLTCDNSFLTFRWSPDGQSFAYVVETASESTYVFEWHLVTRGVDRVMGTTPAWCHCGNGSEDFSIDTGFSPDGQILWLVDYVGRGTSLQIRRLDGSLVGSDIRGDKPWPSPLTMGVWSGTDLFFRDSQGVERWSSGAVRQFLPGIAWLHPEASPNGGQLVYAARGADGAAHVYVADTSNGQTKQLSSRQANSPFYLSSRYVWYQGERLCSIPAGDQCYFNVKSIPTGKTYIYDLQTGTESESIITDIADVWPHGA